MPLVKCCHRLLQPGVLCFALFHLGNRQLCCDMLAFPQSFLNTCHKLSVVSVDGCDILNGIHQRLLRLQPVRLLHASNNLFVIRLRNSWKLLLYSLPNCRQRHAFGHVLDDRRNACSGFILPAQEIVAFPIGRFQRNAVLHGKLDGCPVYVSKGDGILIPRPFCIQRAARHNRLRHIHAVLRQIGILRIPAFQCVALSLRRQAFRQQRSLAYGNFVSGVYAVMDGKGNYVPAPNRIQANLPSLLIGQVFDL